MNVWKNKSVLLTGHTGFKGGWLSLWLSELGAKVHGVALEPPTEPNFFSVAKVNSVLASDIRLDIRDNAALQKCMLTIQPEIVFHLAAQPLVQYSYDFPLETYSVNVMGTVHVLDAMRSCESIRAAVMITSDKCYENQEKGHAYCETDRLGGIDPYSSSKACAELVIAAYRASYFSSAVPIASARAGNVIGGGDWAANRLVPDCIRAYSAKKPMILRYPHAVRPWQHVLEPIHGYILLAEHLLSDAGSHYTQAWNFGPNMEDVLSVGKVATKICNLLNVPINMPVQTQQRHEATLLHLNSDKAKAQLNWYPRWELQKSIAETVEWYKQWLDGNDMLTFSRLQIEQYLAVKLGTIING